MVGSTTRPWILTCEGVARYLAGDGDYSEKGKILSMRNGVTSWRFEKGFLLMFRGKYRKNDNPRSQDHNQTACNYT